MSRDRLPGMRGAIKTVRVPMHDTGLGIEAGYKNDAELIAAGKAQREAMDPVSRAVLDRIDERMDRAIIEGEA